MIIHQYVKKNEPKKTHTHKNVSKEKILHCSIIDMNTKGMLFYVGRLEHTT